MEAFDAAQKIKVIKEVREIFKLGLKEVWGGISLFTVV